MTDHALEPLLAQLLSGTKLAPEQAERTFQMMLNGGASPAQIAAILVAMKMRGESVDEIAAGAKVLRMKAVKIKAPAGTIDVCGTGGDGLSTLNISTAVAFVVAGAGVPVAKHGNRAVSSRSGSADVLKEVGVNVDAKPEAVEKQIATIGIGFLFAPLYHPSLKHVSHIRQELKTRTVFNLLGPLANPAAPDFQLLGVYDQKLCKPMAEVLHKLGCKAAWVVAGTDGLDELSIAAPTRVAQLKDGVVTEFDVTPEDAGFAREPLNQITGGSVEDNGIRLRSVLLGEPSAYRRAVCLNAAAAFVVAGKAADLKEGVALAMESIDSGKAYGVLQKLLGNA